jgi:NAD(P)-dependent dehydrogenase (short-subunit alcohol dehydrogenase family)
MSSRRILITGVSRGLGRAMAQGLAALGHTIIGCARSRASITQLQERFPKPHRFDVVDISNNNDVARWADAVITDGGPPELVLNNAGVINESAQLWETPPEEFARLVNVNILGVYHVVRHFVPAMVERNTGIIVNFSSGWGRSASPLVGPYCTTKFAVEGFSKALAAELPAAMASIPLNPGVIHTEMLETCWGETASNFPSAEQWAKKVVPYLLTLSARDNGRSLTAPG